MGLLKTLNVNPALDMQQKGILGATRKKVQANRDIAYEWNDGGRENAGYWGNTKDCVVRAFAVAMEKRYDDVMRELKKEYLDHHNESGVIIKTRSLSETTGWNAVTIKRLLEKNGWLFYYMDGGGVPACYPMLKQGRWIMVTSGHAVAVVDGVFNDTWDSRFKNNRKRSWNRFSMFGCPPEQKEMIPPEILVLCL